MDRIKELIAFMYHKILDKLDRKIEVINKAIAKDSRNNDPQRSAVYKYETGREMMHKLRKMKCY